jgi:hypothetical protein
VHQSCCGCVGNWTEACEVRGPNSTGFWTVAVLVMSGKCQTCDGGCVSARAHVARVVMMRW